MAYRHGGNSAFCSRRPKETTPPPLPCARPLKTPGFGHINTAAKQGLSTLPQRRTELVFFAKQAKRQGRPNCRPGFGILLFFCCCCYWRKLSRRLSEMDLVSFVTSNKSSLRVTYNLRERVSGETLTYRSYVARLCTDFRQIEAPTEIHNASHTIIHKLNFVYRLQPTRDPDMLRSIILHPFPSSRIGNR